MNRLRWSGVILLGIGLLWLFHSPYVGKAPLTLHAWAQFDQLAIVQAFQEENHAVWETHTLVYNKQYPGWTEAFSSTRTSSDLALHTYLVAKLSNWLVCSPITVFHGYVLVWSLIAWIAVFRIALRWSNNFALAFVGFLLFGLSPVLIFYQSSALITVPAWASMILGVAYFQGFTANHQLRNFYLSLAWLTLATLTRTTFLIPLLAMLGVTLLQAKRQEWSKELLRYSPAMLSLSILIGYLFWSGQIRARYGSLFLGNLMPAKDVADFQSVWQHIWEDWFFDYYPWPIWMIFAGAISWGAITQRGSWRKHLGSPWIRWIVVYTLGNVLFFLAMSKQYINHDYYFVDTGILPLWLLAFGGLIAVYRQWKLRRTQTVYVLGLLLMALSSLPIIHQKQAYRHHVDETSELVQCYHNFERSKAWLDQQGVPRTAKLLVFNSMIPNMAFFEMHRKGYTVLDEDTATIETLFHWSWDYALIQPELFRAKIQPHFPALISELEPIASNGHLILCKKRNAPVATTWENWLRDSQRDPILSAAWRHGTARENSTSQPSITVSATFDESEEYPAVISFPISKRLNGRKIAFETETEVQGSTKVELQLCVAIFDRHGKVLYNENTPHTWSNNYQRSERKTISFSRFEEASELRFYLWNQQKVAASIKQFAVHVY